MVRVAQVSEKLGAESFLISDLYSPEEPIRCFEGWKDDFILMPLCIFMSFFMPHSIGMAQ